MGPRSTRFTHTRPREGMGLCPRSADGPHSLAASVLQHWEYIYERLSGWLVADPSALMSIGWTPPLATAAELARLMQANGTW